MSPVRQVGTNAYRILALLCAFSAIVLFAFRAAELSGMSAAFAASVIHGEWVFFAHHLLYQPVIHIFAIVLDGAGCDAVCAGQTHSILWALVVIASSYLIVLTTTRSTVAACATGVLVLCSHDFWVFSTQLEPYIPLIGMNALIATIIIRNGPRPLNSVTTAIVTAIFTFSLLFHQANVFFLIPLATCLTLLHGRTGLLAVLKIGAVAGVIALSINILIFWTTQPEVDLRHFKLWLTYYGVVSDEGHGAWQALLTLDPVRLKQTARSVVATILTSPSDALQTAARFFITALLLVVLIWNAIYTVKRRSNSGTRIFLMVWTATFLIFFAWWHSGVHKFFLLSVVPIAILCALTVNDLVTADRVRPLYRRMIAVSAVTVLSVVAFVNFDRSVLPLTEQGSGIMRISGKLANAAPPGCVLYTKRRFGGYLSTFFGVDDVRPFQMMYMKYHFGRFNRDIEDSVHVSTDVREDGCNVILLDWLSREDFQWKERGTISLRQVRDDVQADEAHPNWPEFIAWILDVQPAPDGSSVSYDDFFLFQADDGEAFVRIDRKRRAHAGSLDAILETVDHAVRSDPFGSATRSEHRSLNKFRNRVFGYS